jgi:hypothetical protein
VTCQSSLNSLPRGCLKWGFRNHADKGSGGRGWYSGQIGNNRLRMSQLGRVSAGGGICTIVHIEHLRFGGKEPEPNGRQPRTLAWPSIRTRRSAICDGSGKQETSRTYNGRLYKVIQP